MGDRRTGLIGVGVGLVGALVTSPCLAGIYIPWFDGNIDSDFELMGVLAEESQANELASAGNGRKIVGPSEINYAAMITFDLLGSKPDPRSASRVRAAGAKGGGEHVTAAAVTGPISLQPAGIPTASGSATNLSADAQCAVGYQDAGFFTPYHAFRWTASGGPVDLGTLVPASNSTLSSFAWSTSSDCSVVVGVSADLTGGLIQHAFRWTQAGGMVALVPPSGASRASRAFAVSSDGAVVVGDAEFVDGVTISGFRNGAFRWTSGGGFADLGALESGFFSVATAVSSDGSVVVGQGGVSINVGGSSTNGSRAFRWTQAGGIVALAPLTGDSHGAATAVSSNGAIVFGISSPRVLRRDNLGFDYGTDTRAFRWTQATGVQDLKQVLISAGIDLTGIDNLVAITGVSADGQWIQGQATTPTTGPNDTVAFLLQYCDAAIAGTCREAPAQPPPTGLAITLSATSVNLGAVTHGATAAAPTPVTITNNGTGMLNISAITIGGTDAAQFSQTNTCGALPANVAVGASCTITTSFAPASAGAKSASLVITSNAAVPAPPIALSGTGADFTLSSTSTSVSVAAGQSATVPLSLATSGAGLTTVVTFTASGNPMGTTVSFNPSTVAAGSASGSTTLTITTTSRVAALWAPPGAVMFALAMLLAMPAARRRVRGAGYAALAASLIGITSCGGGGDGGGGGTIPNGTPAGSYTITVTATAGAVTRTTTVTLNVT